ncbi:unnamed protein product [Candidula unifasciata]|uniref:SAP domain-containing protein n=1 Tax=Candidula unifasciata TaxID=100452 RepID=A0A8S4A5U9_9EUPU|nr:unnamed protein product [Candidula unifasciata]
MDEYQAWVHSTSSDVLEKTDADNPSVNSNASYGAHSCQIPPEVHSSGGRDEFSLKLSRINGAINRMTKEQLQEKLAHVRLNTSGVKDVLKKRLKHYYKRQKLVQSNSAASEEDRLKYAYLVVIDFEATCSESNENFVHEIIEFPAVLIDTQNQAVCNVFQRFCKPRVNPKLTEFCTSLTGITQSQVDKAKDFTEVFAEFEEWLSLHQLGTEHKFAVLTDGPWDMARFLKTQVELSGISFPRWAKQWINLRKAYAAFYGCKRVNLHKMLEDLGMKFQGRPHCGLDDAQNIAAVTVRLLQDGCVMRVNEHLHEGLVSPQKRTGSSRSSEHSKTHMSPNSQISNHRNYNNHNSNGAEWLDIPQEGENLEDLFEYLKIQKS